MKALIDRLAKTHTLTDDQLLALITADDGDADRYLAEQANALRQRIASLFASASGTMN